MKVKYEASITYKEVRKNPRKSSSPFGYDLMGYSLLTNLSGKTLHPNFLLVKSGLAVLVIVCEAQDVSQFYCGREHGMGGIEETHQLHIIPTHIIAQEARCGRVKQHFKKQKQLSNLPDSKN